MKVRVATDSGSGLSEKDCQALDIDFLPLQVNMDDKSYLDGVNLTVDALYDAIENGAMPGTSLPPLGMVEDLLTEYEEQSVTDLVLITLSNGLSSTNSTVSAAARAHGIKVHTLDLFTTLSIEWYTAMAASQLARAGVAPEEIIRRLKEAIALSRGYLIPEDLDHLAKGGRLTPAAAKLAGLLKIKPILEVSVNTEGKVGTWDKVRTMHKAIKKAAGEIGRQLEDGKEYEFFVLDARNEEGALQAVESLKEEAGDSIHITRHPMFAVIAAHTGVGAVGLQFIPKIEGVEI